MLRHTGSESENQPFLKIECVSLLRGAGSQEDTADCVRIAAQACRGARQCLILDSVSADKEKGKEKLEDDEAAAASTMAVSASLMPPIWDKTIPYDGESFHLEYMDLDEFLLENGIPASPTHLAHNLLLPAAELDGKESAGSPAASPPSSSTAVFQPSETVSSTGGSYSGRPVDMPPFSTVPRAAAVHVRGGLQS